MATTGLVKQLKNKNQDLAHYLEVASNYGDEVMRARAEAEQFELKREEAECKCSKAEAEVV